MPSFNRNVGIDPNGGEELYDESGDPIELDTFGLSFHISAHQFFHSSSAGERDSMRQLLQMNTENERASQPDAPAPAPLRPPTDTEALLVAFCALTDNELFGLPDEDLNTLRERLGVEPQEHTPAPVKPKESVSVPTQTSTQPILKSIIDGLHSGQTLSESVLNEMRLLA